MNPETDVPALAFNTLFHQVAGINVSSIARAFVAAHWSSPNLVVDYQAEAWNHKGAQAHPVLARTSTGVYTLTFAATYLDENDVAVPTSIMAPRCGVNKMMSALTDIVASACWIDPSNPLLVHIWTWQPGGGGGTPEDCPFWVEVG